MLPNDKIWTLCCIANESLLFIVPTMLSLYKMYSDKYFKCKAYDRFLYNTQQQGSPWLMIFYQTGKAVLA